MSYSVGGRRPDNLDKVVLYLQKRDGIDKVLKIIRYTAKLLSATAFNGANSELAGRIDEFEKSIGTSRKAYRLGKFLAGVNTLRKRQGAPLATLTGVLELIATSGEGLYYFVDQFIWLAKAGLLPPHTAKRLNYTGAWAEAIGYSAGIVLNTWRVYALLEREIGLAAELARRQKLMLPHDEDHCSLESEVTLLRSRRTEYMLKIVQDVADMMLAVNDIRGGKGRLNNPMLLCSAGLLSALISARKNWLSL